MVRGPWIESDGDVRSVVNHVGDLASGSCLDVGGFTRSSYWLLPSHLIPHQQVFLSFFISPKFCLK